MTTIEVLQLEFRGTDVSLTAIGNGVIAVLKAIETQAAQTKTSVREAFSGAGLGGITVDMSGIQAAQTAIRATTQTAKESKAQQTQVSEMWAAREKELYVSTEAISRATWLHIGQQAQAAAAVRVEAAKMWTEREKAAAAQVAATTASSYKQQAASAQEARATEAALARSLANETERLRRQTMDAERVADKERVRLARETAQEVAAVRRQAAQDTRRSQDETTAANQGANDVAFMFGGGPLVAAARIVQGLTAATAAAFALGASIAVVVIALYKAAEAAYDLGKAVATYIVSTFAEAIKSGVEFNASLETGRIGVASTLLTFREFVDAQGNVIGGSEAFSRAMEVAAGTQDLLRASAFRTTATFEELEKGFTNIFAAAARGKSSIEDIVRLNETIANMATALRVPFDVASRQMALALMGVERASGRIGSFLRSMHIDNPTLKSWIEQGTAVENLQKALQRYGDLGEVIGRTFAGRLSNMKDLWQQLTGVMAVPLFEKLSESMGKVVDIFVDLSGKTARFRPEIMALISTLGEGLAAVFTQMAITAESALSIVASVVHANGLSWTDVFVNFAVAVAGIVKNIGKMFLDLTFAISHPWETMIDGMRAAVTSLLDKIVTPFLAIEKILVAAKALRDGKSPLEAAKIAYDTPSAFKQWLNPPDSGHLSTAKGAAQLKLEKEKLDEAFADSVESILKASTSGKEALDRALAVLAGMRNKAFGEQAEKLDKDALAWERFAARVEAASSIASAAKGPERDYERINQEYKKNLDEAEKLALKHWGALYRGESEFIQISLALEVEKEDKERDVRAKVRQDALADAEKLRSDLASAEKAYWDAITTITTTGAETKQQAIENAYTKGIAKIVNAQIAGNAAIAEAEAKGGLSPEVAKARRDKITADFEAAKAREVAISRESNALLQAEQSRDWATYRQLLAKHLELVKGMSPQEAQLAALRETADLSLKTAQTMNEGIVAGWYQVQASIREQGQITADFIVDTWRTMQQSFDDILVGGIKNGWQGVLDALSAASDGYLKNFSKMVTEMVTTWIAGQNRMASSGVIAGGGAVGPVYNASGAQVGYNGGTLDMTTGGSHGGNVVSYNAPSTGNINYGAAAGAGLGAAASAFGGATGGAASFGEGIAPYLSIAATIATISSTLGPAAPVGYVIAALVALVGLIVNLMNPSTLQTYLVTNQTLKLSSRGDVTGGIMAADGSRTALTASSVGGQALIDYRNKLSGTLFDTLMFGAPDIAKDLGKSINEAISRYLLGINFKVSAGSDEDIQKDFENLFSRVIPQEMWAQLFGMRVDRSGPLKPIPGITGGTNYDIESGLSQSGPLVQFLTKLGFTIGAIEELASQSQLTDPEVFLTRFKSLVEIVVRVNNLRETLSKSSSQVWEDVLTERNTTPAKAFADQAKTLETMASNISSYTGDVQIEKQKELLDLFDKYAAAQRQAITQLLDLAQQFGDKIDALFIHMAELGKSVDEQFAAAWARQQGLLNPARGTGRSHGVGVSDTGEVYSVGVESGNVFKAMTTADQITKAYEEMFSDLAKIWDTLLARLTQAQSLKAAFAELTANLSMSNAAIWDAAHKNPFRIIAENVADLGEKVKWAASMDPNSQAWLDVMQDIGTQGVATFQAIAAEIANIHAAQLSMNNDIDAQILSIHRSLMGNQAQLDKWNQEIQQLTQALAKGDLTPDVRAYNEQRLATLQGYTAGYNPNELIDDYMRVIQEDQAKLLTATTPEEVARLTKEIQEQINLYLAQFNNENQTPETRAKAVHDAEVILESTRKSANAAYDAFNAVLTQAKTTLLGMLSGIGTGLDTFITTVEDDIELVRAAFVKLKTDTVAAFNALASSVTDPNSGLIAAIEGTSALITGGGGVGGFNGAVSDATTALGSFKDEIGNVINKLGQLDPNVTTGTQGGSNFSLTPSEAAQYGVAGTRNAYRREPNSFRPSVGVFG